MPRAPGASCGRPMMAQLVPLGRVHCTHQEAGFGERQGSVCPMWPSQPGLSVPTVQSDIAQEGEASPQILGTGTIGSGGDHGQGRVALLSRQHSPVAPPRGPGFARAAAVSRETGNPHSVGLMCLDPGVPLLDVWGGLSGGQLATAEPAPFQSGVQPPGTWRQVLLGRWKATSSRGGRVDVPGPPEGGFCPW